jgi:amicyanin
MRAGRRRTLTVILVIGLSLLWAAVAFAVGGAPTNAGSGHAVEIADFTYAPAELTIQVGDTVTWTNRDAVEHTATATDGSWDTGPLGEGESASITFTAAGTYEYLCTPHPTMTGRIVVVAATPPAPTPSAAPTGGGGSIPDVAMSAGAGAGAPSALPLIGGGLVALALLVATYQAVSRRRGEPRQP